MYLKNYNLDELKSWCVEQGVEQYRAAQILNAVYGNNLDDFSQIETLPKAFREKLSETFEMFSLKITKVRKSVDGSVKFLFELNDGKHIEAVYMPWYDDDFETMERITLCISSMAGCPVECAFCATGTLGLLRNLTPAEIIDQILLVQKELGCEITNIVFMGMGEPLLNYKNVVHSLEIMTAEWGLNLSRRKITLSTVGITNRIKQLHKEIRPVKLALSLHATTDETRGKIIPLARNLKLSELLAAVEEYYRETKMPVTYEYIPFLGFNDTPADARRLAKILKRVPSRVNIIPFNDISFAMPSGFGKELKPTPKNLILEFGDIIRQNGGRVTIRDTFGQDIEAACGQLALSE
ncbi:MAG: 23S rRNA (adenine(2503)-C(2))-methyltransferase RlmN [Ignavibacteriae bacterium HGW-Ignavibacteriae-1]|nr:MAG: 23S rRNA (adenine(2503)-C(2))-methyltransferase RlmN [Ignavibacteriae bacterium HGW-Ignavibacteriae-1]